MCDDAFSQDVADHSHRLPLSPVAETTHSSRASTLASSGRSGVQGVLWGLGRASGGKVEEEKQGGIC
jgi:hypothetical protein